MAPGLRTDDARRATYKGAVMRCAEGEVTSEGLTRARIG